MLRLAHQILSQKPIMPKTIYPQTRADFLRQYQLAQIMIASPACHTIIADNVATYYADTPKQDWTLNGKNFACIAPPFQTGGGSSSGSNPITSLAQTAEKKSPKTRERS